MSRARAVAPVLRRLTYSGAAALSDCGRAVQQQQPAALQDGGALLAAARAALRPWNRGGGGGGFACRPLSAAAGEQQAAGKGGRAARRAAAAAEKEGLVSAEEEFSAITDKIPQRPVTATEAGGYSLVIVAALGFAGAVAYAALNELLFQPKEYQCFNHTLSKIKDDPRITVRLGEAPPASRRLPAAVPPPPNSAAPAQAGLGTPAALWFLLDSRRAAFRTVHRVYNDGEGREHVQLQFHMRGPSGRATVNADMHKDGSAWRYNFLYLDVEAPIPQQVVLVRPGQTDATDY
ncbi:hypothetical protein CHLNCDRAFT_141854 [Chlorella variabilis]|uniref:Mitochondrial import inner membrane translocase subunit Tim21 n=1 Tax=Chlorella variabilis TaxID=554065 RepID=E1ZTQ4_CHLVA|nr:hypothetical protein CHLNCDRAFT_141854 [Chlorella variabilis]EFN50809.1 hypothetical protein CHLNCDRAFT_141854 [Chlorella variabilis]|eukprot:XP_005842911.1 hypothetical protein CHLNCDRAFT_141854 [Chlorella variabilis]